MCQAACEYLSVDVIYNVFDQAQKQFLYVTDNFSAQRPLADGFSLLWTKPAKIGLSVIHSHRVRAASLIGTPS